MRGGFHPSFRKTPGEENGNPLQYSCLENSMDREAWWTRVYGVTKSQTQLNDFTFSHFQRFQRASQVELVVKNSPANAGDIRDEGSVLGLGRSPGV